MKIELFDGYVEKVENVKFNLDNLLFEYNTYIEANLHDVEGQLHKEFYGMKNSIMDPITNKCPEFLNCVKIIQNFFSFNTIVYRKLFSKNAFGWHQDEGMVNFHIPLTSNPGCWFVFDGKSFRLPADGSLYKVNNNRYHTFVNAGFTPRVHLIFENIGTNIRQVKALHDTKNFFKK